jgi:hypothetical protein
VPSTPWKPKKHRAKSPAKKPTLTPPNQVQIEPPDPILLRTLRGWGGFQPIREPWPFTIEPVPPITPTKRASNPPELVPYVLSPIKQNKKSRAAVEYSLELAKSPIRLPVRQKKITQRKRAIRALKPTELVPQLELSPVKTRSGRQAGQIRFI